MSETSQEDAAGLPGALDDGTAERPGDRAAAIGDTTGDRRGRVSPGRE